MTLFLQNSSFQLGERMYGLSTVLRDTNVESFVRNHSDFLAL